MDFQWVEQHAWLLALTVILIGSVFIGGIALVGNYLWISSLNSKMGQVDNIRISIESWALNTTGKMNVFVEEQNSIAANQDSRIRAIEDKMYEISTQQAALQAQVAQLNETEKVNLTSFNSTIQRMQMQLAFQYAILLKLNSSNATFETGNTTEPGLPPYADLQCYKDLRQSFGQYLNVEWLCNAAKVLEDYMPFQEQACGCAREAGFDV